MRTTAIATHGLLVEAYWTGGYPATRFEPDEPGSFEVDAIYVDEPEEAADLFRDLGLNPRLAHMHVDLDRDEFPSVYEWAENEPRVYEEAPTR